MGNKKMICKKCDNEFTLTDGKPGKINECHECYEEVEVYRAEGSDSEENGFAFTITKRPHDEVLELKPAYLRIAREIEKENKVRILNKKERSAIIRRKQDEPDVQEE